MDAIYRSQRHFYDLTRKYYLLGRDALIEGLAPPPGGSVLEGLLARDTTLGAMTYPPGTRVLTATPRLPGAQPGDLLFSPSRGRSARRDGGEDVAAGSSVLQAPDGTVRSVLSNREAGVLDVAAMRMTP